MSTNRASLLYQKKKATPTPSFYTFKRQALALNHHKQYIIRCCFKWTRVIIISAII